MDKQEVIYKIERKPWMKRLFLSCEVEASYTRFQEQERKHNSATLYDAEQYTDGTSQSCYTLSELAKRCICLALS
jgi:hypothetical protein